MRYDITLIPGDGIGPEVTKAARKVIDAVGADINWHVVEAGGEKVLDEYKTPPSRLCFR